MAIGVRCPPYRGEGAAAACRLAAPLMCVVRAGGVSDMDRLPLGKKCPGKKCPLELDAATHPLFSGPSLWPEAVEPFEALAGGTVSASDGLAAMRAKMPSGRRRACGDSACKELSTSLQPRLSLTKWQDPPVLRRRAGACHRRRRRGRRSGGDPAGAAPPVQSAKWGPAVGPHGTKKPGSAPPSAR